MSDSYEDLEQDEDEYEVQPHWWSPNFLFTAEASAIVAFTLAVIGLMGFISDPLARALLGFPEGPHDMPTVAVVSGLVVLVLLVGSFWLSYGALVDDDYEVATWTRHLAVSSAVIAAIAVVLSVATIGASLLAVATNAPGLGS
jgi:hypothetical protein